MNDSQERLTHALETYAAALGELTPSAQLEARMQAALQREPLALLRRHRLRRWGLAIAASIALLAVATVVFEIVQGRALAERELASARHRASDRASDLAQRLERGRTVQDAMVFPSGAVSLWPTQGTVFRVRSTLNAAADPQWVGQQYWIDVRVANDGSMRIERVLTTDGTQLFARP